MILDSLWLFSGGTGGTGNADGATDSPTTGTQVSSNIVDVGMIGGIPASATNAGGGRDLGIGDDPAMKLMVTVTVAFTGGTSLIVAIQTAPDAGNNTPGHLGYRSERPHCPARLDDCRCSPVRHRPSTRSGRPSATSLLSPAIHQLRYLHRRQDRGCAGP